MELSQIICSIHRVSDEWLKVVEGCSRSIHLKRGELLITQGKKDGNLYFVRQGLLRSFAVTEDKEDTLWFAVEGDALGSMHSLYENMPAIASVEALVPTDLYCISYKELDRLFLESKELSYWGCKLAMEALYSLERRYSYIGSGDAYTRYKMFIKMRPVEMIRQIPLKYIASYLKITPQTLSKMRLKFSKE